MATNIFFNGRLISVPGSYSEVDASGLEQIGLGASGIVAIIGEAEGGEPVSAGMKAEDFIKATRPQQVRDLFRSGELREAGAIVFDPSRDANIQAGAQQIVFMKTNQATQSSATFGTTQGDSMTVTSEDYGAFTEQINLEIQAGTNQGKLLTAAFEETTEAGDDIGGLSMFDLTYLEETNLGWDTMKAQVLSSGIRAFGTRDQAGQDGDVTTGIQSVLTVVSANAGDTTQTATVYGLVGGTPTREKVKLAGTTPVATVNTYDAGSVYAVELDAVAAGNVTVRDSAVTVLLTITAGGLASGGVKASTMYVANEGLHAVADGASTANIWLVGKNTSGAIVIDRFALNGTNHVSGAVTNFTEIQFIVMGEIAAARTVTINGNAVKTANTAQSTVLKAADYFNARNDGTYGFTFTIVTGLLNFLIADLDLTTAAVDIDNPATGSFYANLFYVLDWMNSSSELVDAVRIDFAPQIEDINIDSVLNATTYTVSIDTISISYTSDGSATLAEIQAGLSAAINANKDVNFAVTAAANGSAVRVTADTPLGFLLAESDANLSLTAVQTTDGVGAAPDNTSGPVYLTGGSEGLTTFTEVQLALNLLKKIRVNSIVLMTADPAAHAALVAHCDFMGGIGRSERDGFVGLLNTAMTGLPSKTEIKAQIVDLNTRHIRAFAQEVERFDTSGTRVVMEPKYQACVAAGMQAGSDVGTSLTFKYGNVLSVNQASTWNPIDDAEEMINAGLCFMETVDGVGRRFVRNVTTHLQSNNLAFIEGSVNEAVNFATFNFRTGMEFAVGKKGFSGTINAAKSVALGLLGLLVDTEVLVAYQSLAMDLSVDVLEVDVEMAPVIPINFIKNTVHLVTIRQTA